MVEIESEEFLAVKTAFYKAIGQWLLKAPNDDRAARFMENLEKEGFTVARMPLGAH